MAHFLTITQRRRVAALALAGALAAVCGTLSPAAAQSSAQTAAEVDARLDDLFGAHAPYRAFLAELQAAVAADDRSAVAAMVSYPLNTKVDGAAVSIDSAAAFVDQYGALMTEKVTEAVAEQTYAGLFANAQGAMIGDGEIWFTGVGEDETVKIIAINN